MDEVAQRRPSLRGLWLQHRFTAVCVFSAAVASFATYHWFSDGDFSFLMTLGSLLTVGSFCLLVAKVVVLRSAAGLSVKSLQAYALVYAGRLASILVRRRRARARAAPRAAPRRAATSSPPSPAQFYEGYLPYDKSGDGFYQACEVLALVLVVGLLAAALLVLPRAAKDRAADGFGAYLLPSELGVLWLVVPAAGLALLLHPNLNANWLTDTAWTTALYLEAVAIFPQLVMFHRQQERQQEKEVEPFTANFVFGVAAARVLTFLFWLSSYHELNDKYADALHRKYPGVMVVLSQVVNLLLVADYMYVWMSSARSRRPVLLPQTI